MNFLKITELNLKNKIIFLRTDMNVPIIDGNISDDTRILASLKTIQYALEQGAFIIIATHLGRPKEGIFDTQFSVDIIAKYLSNLLNTTIPIIVDLDQPVKFVNDQRIVMLENVRFNIGEKANSDLLGMKYAKLCDIFVHDAFATAHRQEASTDSIGRFANVVCAGLLMTSELTALSLALQNPKKPTLAIVGGSKVSTKLTILRNLATQVDFLIVGGGILNTFLLANGHNIGQSLVEKDLVSEAKQIITDMKNLGSQILLPNDVVTSTEFSNNAKAITKNIEDIKDNDIILDIGTLFANQVAQVIMTAGTVIWNGPLGVFEFDQFANGTKIIATAINKSSAYSLAGGGDTISAINKFALADGIDYISTAGGALLEFLEGKKLPAIALLEDRA